MPDNSPTRSGRSGEEQPIADRSAWRGIPAVLGVALPFGIGASIFGDWLGDQSQRDLARLLESSLTPAAILVGAAWVAIALPQAMEPAERRGVRMDDLLFTAVYFSVSAVVGIALALIFITARTHAAIGWIGLAAAGFMGLTLGGILQLTFRALLVVRPGKDENAEASGDVATNGGAAESS